MAKEKAPIISVLNDVVRVNMPDLVGARQTFLAVYAEVGTSLTVLDNSSFAQNDWVILGEPGSDKTEIVKINAAVTRGTALTVTTTTFAHAVDTPVTEIFYDQVAIYGSTTATDAAPTLIGSATAIDVARGFNEFQPSTTYAYYYARFYNSQTTTYSSYSTAVAATGLARNSVRKIIETALEKTDTKLDSVDGLTLQFLINRLNDWQDEVMLQKKKWSFLSTNNAANLLVMNEDQQEYDLPTDIQNPNSNESILQVMVYDNRKMEWIDTIGFRRKMLSVGKSYLASAVGLADVTITLDNSGDFADSGTITIEGDSISYTANNKTTGVLSGVTGITATHAIDKEVYQNPTKGEPYYYTVAEGKILLWPVPDSTEDLQPVYIDYYKKVTDLTEEASVTEIPFYQSAQYYLMWCIENKKGDPSKEGDGYEARFRQILQEALKKDAPSQKVAFSPMRGRRLETYSKYHITFAGNR